MVKQFSQTSCFPEFTTKTNSVVERVCMCVSLHAQSCQTLCDHMDYSPPGSSVHGDSSGKKYWSGLPCPPPGDIANPGIKPMSLMSPALAGEFIAHQITKVPTSRIE